MNGIPRKTESQRNTHPNHAEFKQDAKYDWSGENVSTTASTKEVNAEAKDKRFSKGKEATFFKY